MASREPTAAELQELQERTRRYNDALDALRELTGRTAETWGQQTPEEYAALAERSDTREAFAAMAAAFEAMTGRSLDLYRAPTVVPSIPPAFRSGRALVPSALPLQGVIASIHNAREGKGGWPLNGEGQPVYTFHQPQGTVHVSLGPAVGEAEPANEAARLALWAQFKALSDLDADVLLASLAQWIEHRDAEGYAVSTAPAVLDYRGVQPMRKADRPGGKRYRAGHRTEDLAAVSQSYDRLGRLYLDLQNVEVLEQREGRKPRRSRYSLKTELLHIPDKVTQRHLNGTEVDVAWRYRPGKWLTPYLEAPNQQFALLMQTALGYDPHNQRWEKRLARYFLFHLRIKAGAGGGAQAPLRRNVGAVLVELGLDEWYNRRNPQQTVKRFEAAMNRLRDDQVIGAWGLTSESRAVWASLPARGWLDAWLGTGAGGGQAVMEVLPPADTVEQYGRLADRAQRAKREAAAKAAAAARKAAKNGEA